jgi:NAD(P)-dependent dehydrogenase (short-subunit alcohol dehydrogenase family)
VRIGQSTFLVTGASRGIGRALVLGLAREGARVALNARSKDALEGVLGEVRALGAEGVAAAGDVGCDEDAARVARTALDAFGRVDVLVNNAAILTPPAPVAATSPETWERVLRTNVIGTANLIRHVLPSMEAEGRGLIVNLSSGWGRVGEAGVAPYCASKFAVEALTQSLAAEVRPGIVVIALNPGVVDTDMLREAWAGEASRYERPEALVPRWMRLFARVDPSWNGRSLDLDDFGA